MTEREPSIISDFADIRIRMLGDDKPKPKLVVVRQEHEAVAWDMLPSYTPTYPEYIAVLDWAENELNELCGMKDILK